MIGGKIDPIDLVENAESALDVRRCAAYYSGVCLFWEVSEGRDDASCVFSWVCGAVVVRVQQ